MTAPETVLFRRYPDGEVLTVMPGEVSNWGHVVCYQHVGQHGEGDWSTIVATTRKAAPAEYAPLLQELLSIGYSFDRVRVRLTRLEALGRRVSSWVASGRGAC